MPAKEARFRGHLHYPLHRGGTSTFNKDLLGSYYTNNETADGGWYPIGANQTWHNGIHLTASRGDPIHSIAKGKLIAARLGNDYSNEKYPFGSPRFALIQHDMSLLKNPAEQNPSQWQTRDIQFYTLYMHLDCQPSEMTDVPWLRSFLPFLSASTPLSGVLARVNIAEDGTGNQKGLNSRTAPTEGRNGKWLKGNVVTVLPKGTIVERCAGRRGNYQEVNVPSKNLTSVWVYDTGNRLVDIPTFTEQVNALRAGGCARLDYPIESGEILGHAGLIKPARISELTFLATYGIHLELFAASNFIASDDMPSWQLVQDDTDDDVLCEYETLLKKINPTGRIAAFLQRFGWDSSGFVDFDDVKSYFHSLSHSDRKLLRGSITRNTSFWSIDWKAMASRNQAWVDEFDFSSEVQESANRYSWWRECEAKGVPLPARTEGKALLYHYHPLAAMEYIDAHLPAPPIFFVKRSDKEYVVTKPADIDIPSRERVWVYEPGKPDWLLGRGQTLQNCEGIGNMGETDLYEALITPATAPGIPPLSNSQKRIWAAIWHSEGALEALNTYDSAFLSFGPMQQTVGKPDAKGELQGALHYVKTHAAQLFQNYFGQYKLDVTEVDETEGELVYGHVKLDGRVLKSAADKQVLRDFIWAYRCVKAMEDTEFRRHFLTHGFNRINIVKGLTANFGGTAVKLSDVYKMELSLSLLLDVHINLPGAAKTIWVKAVKNALGLGNNATLNTSSITEDDEYEMIKEIISLRNDSNMWDPEARAAFIVLCAEDLNDALAQKIGYDNVNDIKTKTGSNSASSYMHDFLKHSR
ncbi:M23 family metallopeptidase [Archangium gephyra]|uniref:M23 family metallopeptidase n=1 Tax=Archangium gephyra TaxID=48 RepID=UPI0035D43EA5